MPFYGFWFGMDVMHIRVSKYSNCKNLSCKDAFMHVRAYVCVVGSSKVYLQNEADFFTMDTSDLFWNSMEERWKMCYNISFELSSAERCSSVSLVRNSFIKFSKYLK